MTKPRDPRVTPVALLLAMAPRDMGPIGSAGARRA